MNYSFGIVIVAVNNSNIECGSNQIIIINEAYWVPLPPISSLWTQLRDIILPSKKQPNYPNTLEVEALCHGKNTCNFIFDKIPQGQQDPMIDCDCHTCYNRSCEVLKDSHLRSNVGCPNQEFVDKYVNTKYLDTEDGANKSMM